MSKEFKWTDELVEEVLSKMYSDIRNEKLLTLIPIGYVASFKEQKTRKPVLFTTEDGVEIFEGDCYHSVNKDFRLSGRSNGLCWYNPSSGEKYFSTREKAEEYIIMNKPLNLSMKEIASCVTDILNNPGPGVYVRAKTEIDLDKLDALIKSKLGDKTIP